MRNRLHFLSVLGVRIANDLHSSQVNKTLAKYQRIQSSHTLENFIYGYAPVFMSCSSSSFLAVTGACEAKDTLGNVVKELSAWLDRSKKVPLSFVLLGQNKVSDAQSQQTHCSSPLSTDVGFTLRRHIFAGEGRGLTGTSVFCLEKGFLVTTTALPVVETGGGGEFLFLFAFVFVFFF